MDAEISYEYASLVGLNKDRLTTCDASGGLSKRGAPLLESDRYLKGIVFEKGGHWAHQTDPMAAVVNRELELLYHHIIRVAELEREHFNADLKS